MLRCRQLFNPIRRYNHSHSRYNKLPKLNNTILESKNNKIMVHLENIEILLKYNYAITLICGIISVFK